MENEMEAGYMGVCRGSHGLSALGGIGARRCTDAYKVLLTCFFFVLPTSQWGC